MSTITNNPPKGTYDWLPQEFAVRKYIFDTWRTVCQRFGYQEYLTPLVESADLYRVKSGEDVGGKELTTFMDRGERELAIRPEMTPSVTRLVSKIYSTTPKPIRWFSIANFYRNEKPQRGRNREFWQLNYDIFGSDSFIADLEAVQIALEIMLAFNPPDGSFELRINNRQLVDEILQDVPAEKKSEVFRILDKFDKLPREEISNRLIQTGASSKIVDSLLKFISAQSLDDIASDSEAYTQTEMIMQMLNDQGYGKWVKFSPKVLRGFDYYDGTVFEVFDNNPQNPRSMFGGGRYNGLASIFGVQSFPAVGCAPGDETTRLFLESWNLIPNLKIVPTQVLVTVFSVELGEESLNLTQQLRKQGINTELYLDASVKLDKQLKYASDKGIPYVAIIGPEEAEKRILTLKNMGNGEQTKSSLEELVQIIR